MMAPSRTCNECGKLYSSRCSLWLHKRNAHNYSSNQPLCHPSGSFTLGMEKHVNNSVDPSLHSQNFDKADIQNGSGITRDVYPSANESSESDNISESESESRKYDSDFSREDSDVNSIFFTETEDEEEEAETEDEEEPCAEDEEEDISDKHEEEAADSEACKNEETYFHWPLSRRYKLQIPWKYTGEVKIRKHKLWLRKLTWTHDSTLLYNIKHASDSKISAFREIANNLRRGGMAIVKNDFESLKKRRQVIRLIASPSTSVREIRHELLKRDPLFVRIILGTIQPLLNSL
jgi:hypothetical protein